MKKVLSRAGTIIGLISSTVYTIFLLSESIYDLTEGKSEVIPIMLLIISMVTGYLLGLRYPKTGPRVMIIASILTGIYLLIVGGIGEFKMALIFTLPFLIPGIILYYFPFNISSAKGS